MRSRISRFHKEGVSQKIASRENMQWGLVLLACMIEAFIGESRAFDATAVLFKVESEIFFRCHQFGVAYAIFFGIPWVINKAAPLSEHDKKTAPEEVGESEDDFDDRPFFSGWGAVVSVLVLAAYLLAPMKALDWLSELGLTNTFWGLLCLCLVVRMVSKSVINFLNRFP